MKVAYTVRFCHLLERPKFAVGQIIKPGDKVGTMGSSGQSNATHLHIDCAEGKHSTTYTLAEMELGRPVPAPRQLNWFIDHDLFGIEPYITSYYADPEYQRVLKKVHLGYDVVPVDRHKTTAHHGIRWNRSMNGIVTRVGFDPKGYGHHVHITFEVEEG